MPIQHIKLVKYKPGITPAEVEKVRAALRSLSSLVPSIIELKAGNKLKHPRDQDFDEGIIIVLKDKDALEEYRSIMKADPVYQASMKPYVQGSLHALPASATG